MRPGYRLPSLSRRRASAAISTVVDSYSPFIVLLKAYLGLISIVGARVRRIAAITPTVVSLCGWCSWRVLRRVLRRVHRRCHRGLIKIGDYVLRSLDVTNSCRGHSRGTL